MNTIAQQLFESSSAIRYVATYTDGKLELNQRASIANSSASESDKYEELIVNPTLLKLLTQRGNIDCGGLQFVLIRYGNFFQFIQPVAGGHISVAIERDADVLRIVDQIRGVIAPIAQR